MAKYVSTIVTVPDPKESDIIIPVMGPTGVGKSTFINTAVGRTVMTVGHDLQSCTDKMQHTIISHPSDPTRRIIFVDTPGFDDTFVDDAEILKLIAVWLAHSYSEGIKLAGIIYLHEISQARMLGTSRKNLTMFKKLCGDRALKNVILATTKWDDIAPGVGEPREQQLSNKYWKEMVSQGSKIKRFTHTRESAWAIVDPIVNKDPISVLIQQELVDLQKLLPQSEAGKTLRYSLQELLEGQKEMARQLQDDKGTQGDEEFQRRQEETMQQIRSTLNQIQELKVPLGKRILAFFSL